MNDPRTADECLIYRVSMILPPRAVEVREALVDAFHCSNRGVGLISGERGRGLYLAVLMTADDEYAARARAQQLVATALQVVGVAELAAQTDVDPEVTTQPSLRGGPHPIAAPPALAYRSSTLPDGRVVNAARSDALGGWFAYVEDGREHPLVGRILREVLDRLLELPWGRHARWVNDALAQLAGHMTSRGVRFQCPCCDHLTLQSDSSGTNATCEVCVWEDDRVQLRDPDYAPGANQVSLREARDNYRRHGVSNFDRHASAREPRPEEILEREGGSTSCARISKTNGWRDATATRAASSELFGSRGARVSVSASPKPTCISVRAERHRSC